MATTKTYTETLISLLEKQIIVINKEIKNLEKKSIKINIDEDNLVSELDYLNYNEKRKIERNIDGLEKLKYELNNNKKCILNESLNTYRY